MHPPANRVALQLDQNLISRPDPRPGRGNATYRQSIITSVVLRIRTAETDFQVTGAARFYLVRGDSAHIAGARPDSTRWYVERWEDETFGSAIPTAAVRDGPRAVAFRALPARAFTWCDIKALYR